MVSIGMLLVGGTSSVGQLLAQPAQQPADAAVSIEGTGFEQPPEASLFDVGDDARREIDWPYERIAGSKGVFLIDQVTGATLAVPNAPSADSADESLMPADPEPLTKNAKQHNAAVLAYFTEAGLPSAEVSGMHVTTTMAGDGPADQGIQPSRSKLLYYTTHLERSVGGVPVEGSYCFAALDSDGKVITEGVYWPSIPAEVVHRAKALALKLASAESRASFLTRVKAVRPDAEEAAGSVRIVHTSAGWHGPFEADALYNVVLSKDGGKAEIVRFDDQGIVVQMPDEVPTGIDSAKRR
jgi:hypothetical protein